MSNGQSAPDPVAQVLNTASKAKLKRVKGIGDAAAKRIIQNRPYESGNEVVENEVLPQDTLEKLQQELVDTEGDEGVRKHEVA